MASRAPAPPPRKPSNPIVTVGPQSKGAPTQSGDWVTSSVDYSLTNAPTKLGLSLAGGANLIGTGNAGGTSRQNTLTAASNTGNTTLIAGTASTTMIGGSGDNWMDAIQSQGTVSLKGGSGSSTMYAANGPATLLGGAKNNYLVAGTSPSRIVGQSLVGGTSTSPLHGNTLYGGTGSDTIRSGAGYSTLISGSNAGAATTISAAAASGVSSIRVASVAGLAVGQQIIGNGIAAGTTITAISGTQLTLSAKTTSAITAGTRINNLGNVLIGQGISNSLTANVGNDSLVALSGNSTLLGGTGLTTLLGGGAGTSNWLQSGSAGAGGNTLVGGAGSHTIVAGSGRDSIVGGINQNLLLVTQANLGSLGNDTISLSTLVSARNILGVSLNGASLGDSHLSGTFSQTARNLGTIQNLSGASTTFALGSNAQSIGASTIISGTGSDTLSVAGYTTLSARLDASNSIGRASLVGGGTGNHTFLGSKGGYDTMTGAAGKDLFIIQPSALAGSSFGQINGNGGTDTLQLNAAAILSGTNFNGVSNVEALILGSGNNSIGSLQGSGIQKIVGNTGSDTLSANVYGAVRSVTRTGSNSITLNVLPGTSATSGFAIGQVVTGNGIATGTTITAISSTPAVGATAGTVTLTLSTPTTSLISQGVAITGWLNRATLDGSAALGIPPSDAEKSRAGKAYADKVSSITAANYGLPGELNRDTLSISTLKNDPDTYVHRKGDYLVSYGQNNLLIGGQGNGLPEVLVGGSSFTDNSSVGVLSNLFLGRFSYGQYQVVDNTLVSGAYASNTLVGGSGANIYLINNLPGASTALPKIQNPTTLQSASTIQFTGNGVRLDDAALSSVSAKAAQKIVTANGNNLISIGQNAAQIGIQTIVGGVGSDTFTTPTDYTPSVYLDASKGSGSQSLSSGVGNDTLLAGTGNATLVGGDGNNSLLGGAGSNLILSGVGNSTLDGGFGISTLQADGGVNRFIIRNRYSRILNPYSLERDSLTGQIATPNPVPVVTTPEVGIVDTYVNFDPIQGSPVSQFSPSTPDNSPSITKSPSFASSDLSSFYNLQYFNLLGSANYGVGNALDNTISAAAANALILGMGGNNTIVGAGRGSSLYGNSNANYASPDLYAYAPIDTRTQNFVDGVMGVAGNNSLVAKGGSSYLDGGTGYDDGLFDGSGSNTLVGTGGNDTVVIRHQADLVSLTGTGNTAISSVDLYQLPDNVSNFFLNVTPQTGNSGQVSLDGQRMTAGYAAVSNAKGGNTGSFTTKFGEAPSLNSTAAVRLQVTYGTSDGTTYGSDNVPDANLALNVGTVTADPKNPGKQAVTLSWATPLDPDGNPVGQTMGYLVNYQLVATDVEGTILSSTPYLTYLQGTSQDLTGTSTNPQLLVDNLSSSFTDPYTGITYDSSNSTISYNFKVTAQERVLPAYTDGSGNLIGKPVSLIGGQGNDVLYGDLLDNLGSSISNTRPVLTNNPINPLDPGTIPTPAPWSLSANWYGVFPTYLNGGLDGNDLLIAPYLHDGSGQDFTAYEYINGVPTPVTYSGFNTLVGGFGSDTFVVFNGGTTIDTTNGIVTTGAYDQVQKFGNETASGQHNLIVSGVQYLTLSDTDVSQGKFIDQAWAPYSGQYVAGNRLDNTLSSYGFNNTLLGGGGRDSLYANLAAFSNNPLLLIGGTAYGLDSISGALADYAGGQTSSIYRDTDPVPPGVNGPGTADNSQYWIVNGLYDPNRNSDTLVVANGGPRDNATLDGGAGSDSMVGGTGDDYFYVSSGSNSHYSPSTPRLGADVVIGSGGNDTVIFTGSDVYWSGIAGSTSSILSYALSNDGDAAGGQSISNIKLQDGSPVARQGTGNSTSTGNQHNGKLGSETGSNLIVGNEQSNTLDGGGVGGKDGTGVGCDTLTGGSGADTFVISGYRNSSSNASAKFTAPTDTVPTYNLTGYATDADYAYISDFGSDDLLDLVGDKSQYLIGTAPSGSTAGFSLNNINGGTPTADSTTFGIYYAPGTGTPNLVAVINCVGGMNLGGNLVNQSFGGIAVDGTNANLGGDVLTPGLASGNATGLNYLGFGCMYQLNGSDFGNKVI